MPIDNDGAKSVQVQNYWGGTDAQETFSCLASGHAGKSSTDVNGNTIDFTGPCQTLTSTITIASGEAIQLVCRDIPPGGGVALLNWNQ